MHGYDLIQELEERSGGMWRPSPGSIYPTLQMLEEEGQISGEDQEGKRIYSITDAGRKELAERRERSGGTPPWEFGEDEETMRGLRDGIIGLGRAAWQVAQTGTRDQAARAADVLADARKKLYAILAED